MKHLFIATLIILLSAACYGQNQEREFAIAEIVAKKQNGIQYQIKVVYYNKEGEVMYSNEPYVSQDFFNRMELGGRYTYREFYNLDCYTCRGSKEDNR